MTSAWNRWSRKWCAWALRRVRGPQGLPARGRLHVERLEDRVVMALAGGVNVAAGDTDGDGYVDLVTAPDEGLPSHVRVVSGRDGTDRLSFFAYDPAFLGGASVAAGDVTGDGAADIVTGSGTGGAHVKVFDGRTGRELGSFLPFGGFLGGVRVAAGDVNRDGFADVVVGAGAGGGPHVKVFDGRTGLEMASFFAFDPAFRGGVNVASGDVDGDGHDDLVIGAGPGAGPHVRVVSGADGRELRSLWAFDPAFRGGVTVAAGDVNRDGLADVVAGARSGASYVVAFDGRTSLPIHAFFAYGAFAGGVNVGAADLDRDGGADLLVGAGEGGYTRVSAFSGADLRVLTSAFAYAPVLPFPGFPLAPAFVGPITPVEPPLPPVPTTPPVVPPVPTPPVLTSTADFAAATAFLYTGPNAVQTGVVEGAIDPLRAAVVRGRVVDRNRRPLAGVTVTALGRPEVGRTVTQADGTFDLALNGGGPVVIDFARAGFLSSQRQESVPWRDYAIVDEVVLVPLDERVTAIDLASAAAPFQVARGSVATDGDGTRQATLLFPQGATATMTLPDGSTQALSTLHVRATEYTVGGTGPAAMPGDLPPASGYTYAVELSVDEAVAAGATRVDFSTPVPFYVENFLSFPVGMAVPAGYYDRGRGLWVPSDNGRVVQVLSVAGGAAELDGDGDGDADSAAELAALGVTGDELAQLATLYQAGQSLWRVPVPHFTPWDLNWPYGPPPGAEGPRFGPGDLGNGKQDEQNEECGSVIGIENQTLGESIAITGTPFSLAYKSDRVGGFAADRTLLIPLTRESLPPGLARIEVTIDVAGRRFTESFAPSTDLRTAFVWDGRDAYGRTLQGSQRIEVQIGYVYGAANYQTPAAAGRAFAAVSGVPLTGNLTRMEVTLSQNLVTHVARYDASATALGGWGLDVHHTYDPVGHVLHLGTGEQRGVDPSFQSSIVTVVGTGEPGGLGDGGQAVRAQIAGHYAIAAGPDGSLYIAQWGGWIRRVGPDGIIRTVAGGGTEVGDGGLATQAVIQPSDLALGPDGSFYFAEPLDNRVRRVGPDGIITTVAGTGTETDGPGDGGPATEASMGWSEAIAVGPDGSLYIADFERIRRVGSDGIINTVAGTGLALPGGEGMPATETSIVGVKGLAIGADGSIYFSEYQRGRVRKVTPDGTLRTIAGNGTDGFSGDFGPATQASLYEPDGLALDADGNLYISDIMNSRIHKVSPPGLSALAGFTGTDIVLASDGGGELYRFDSTGRHLDTRDALTGSVIYSFAYTPEKWLSSVTDGDGNVTRVERDAQGNPTAVVGPYGDRTTLTVNSQAYLATVTNPAGETTTLGYGAGGLLTSMTDPLGNRSEMTYDSSGRLVADVDPEFGFTQLVRQDLGGGSYRVTTTNAEGGTRQYSVEYLSDGTIRRTAVDGRGFETVTLIGTDGSRRTTLPDGTVSTTVFGPDPRFGMLAKVVTSQTVTTPGGLTYTMTGSREAAYTIPDDPTSGLATLTSTTIVNGETFTSVYDAGTRTVTTTSAEGRTATTTTDARGRIVRAEVPGVAPTTYEYDARGRLHTVTQSDRTVTYAYDSRGYLASITDPLDRVTRLDYDAAGRVTKQTQPDGTFITFRYDAGGRMVGLTPPGQPEHTFEYNDRDQLTATTAPDVGPEDDTTRYTYNLARQLTREALPGGVVIDYAYCDCGRLTSITAPWGNYTYTYSSTTGELTSIASPGGFTMTIGSDGILTMSETQSGPVAGSVEWGYNSNFRVVTESVNGANAVTFDYDGDGLLTGAGDLTLDRDLSNGRVTGTTLGTVADTVSYDTFGDLDGYRVTVGAATGLEYDFTRDALGQITRKVETVGGVTTTYDYGYDANGQLTTVRENGALVQSYAYDPNGNRLSLTTPSGTETGTYDDQDRLLTYGTKSYAYNADGSLRSMTDSATGETTEYAYDGFGNLTRVDLPDGRVITYLIDAYNRRVGKEVDGVLTEGFLYNGQLTPVAQLDGSGNVVARFVYAGGVNVPAYMVKGGVTYRLITDHLGSVRLVVNAATGVVAQQIDYDAFGRVLIDTNPGFQPFGYAGGLYDADTGLVRFGARDYDAATGRWAAFDPVQFAGKDGNLARYSFNDPLNMSDATGRTPFSPVVTPVPTFPPPSPRGPQTPIGYPIPAPGPTPSDGGSHLPLPMPPTMIPPQSRPVAPWGPPRNEWWVPPPYSSELECSLHCGAAAAAATCFIPGMTTIQRLAGAVFGAYPTGYVCYQVCANDWPIFPDFPG